MSEIKSTIIVALGTVVIVGGLWLYPTPHQDEPVAVCPEPVACPEPVSLDPAKWCALCPLPEPEGSPTYYNCPDPASKNLRFDLEYCELARGIAEEGWHKASAHWGQCCEQCTGKEDPVTGGPTACDGC